ncbi:hypothetical protein CEXT_199011 [Caerostris extrusa]|uniref:Uncharacterized protein n=1 Tax=Caerostris extrusa TaxID=172846 RepID=A0AAV4WR98_CAEEX|nr:hypothetical protein CEXT_199011 [Caerostris extrusa]
MYRALPSSYIQGNLRWRHVVPPSNLRKPYVSATRGRSCETDCCREKKKQFQRCEEKKGIPPERVNVPQKWRHLVERGILSPDWALLESVMSRLMPAPGSCRRGRGFGNACAPSPITPSERSNS